MPRLVVTEMEDIHATDFKTRGSQILNNALLAGKFPLGYTRSAWRRLPRRGHRALITDHARQQVICTTLSQ